MAADSFDFIVVGAGTAGCLVASKLAASPKKPSVLLVEGGSDAVEDNRLPFSRYTNAFFKPELDYGYKTLPQAGFDGAWRPYARGKGVGGTSMVNFMVWTPGTSVDFDRWAEMVGDKAWDWTHVQERYKKLVTLHSHIPAEYQDYAKPRLEEHGQSGPIDVALHWEKENKILLDAVHELGYKVNLDPNLGDPMGIAVCASTMYNGRRTHSGSAFLSNRPDNLTIWTESRVVKILTEDKKAVGIQTIQGRTATASHEVIVSTGSFDSPRLLLLSGIGPRSDLEPLGINVVHDLPRIGKDLEDHVCIFMADAVDSSFSDRGQFLVATDDEIKVARKQWDTDRSGPLAKTLSTSCVGYVKLEETYEWEEFKALDKEMQEIMKDPKVPTYEYYLNGPLLPFDLTLKNKTDAFFSSCIINMSPQARGELRLASADPNEAVLLDPGLLNHPYDRRLFIESVRRARQLLTAPSLARINKGPLNAPKSESDDDIWEFILVNAQPCWHASSSIKMGKREDPKSCVDSDLKVIGMQNLRVADVSVCPFAPNAHPQAWAYMIGQTLVEKLTSEYGLDSP